MDRHLERRERMKRLSLESYLPEYMDANKCIDELLKQLEEERRNVRREKLAVARLQREVARSKGEGTMREKLIHELEEERRLRLESEKRLREVTEESELGRAQMVSLQQQFSRMEETVRSLLQNQGVLEQSAVDTVDIMKAYKDKLSAEVQKLQEESEATRAERADTELEAGQEDEDKDKTKLLVERLKALEEQNSALTLENESQRDQYERCLDEVANQVVQALLTQKDLREECLKLRTRVFDLEQQNRALSVLFQQKIKPASDLLLQKLHSRIMDLSAADLLLEPERSKAFLLSRNTSSPPHELHLNGKPSPPVAKCLSQQSLTTPAPIYPRSCSSSELSLSSACSEFSSGSYTWNDARSGGRLSWEKRLSLGSSAPSNICAAPEEPPQQQQQQQPTRRKESHILEGLRKLQRRKHRSSSCSSRVSKSGSKDCMNSNEGIYSLGIKSSSKGVSKPTHVSRPSRSRRFSYESDDADDELAHRRDNVPTKDNWIHCMRLSHSISDSLCSLEGAQEVVNDATSCPVASNPCTDYDSKERPEKLMSFINNFLPLEGRRSAFRRPSVHRNKPANATALSQPFDADGRTLISDPSSLPIPCTEPQEVAESNFRRLSRDAVRLFKQQYMQKDQGRTQSADGRPTPFSLLKEPTVTKCTQSEESILAIFDAEGEPISLCAQRLLPNDIQDSLIINTYAELQERPTRQKPASSRNYSVLESPEKPSESQPTQSKSCSTREGSAERPSIQLNHQRKLIKPQGSRVNKGFSIPPMNEVNSTKSCGSKIPGFNKSPVRVSKGTTTDPSTGGNSGPFSQEKSPLSPTGRMSRFMKAQGTYSQSPKGANTKVSSRADWGKSSSSHSPQLARRHLDFSDNHEQPTRDKHCEPNKTKLKSPSPPPPPGRTTSLLVRPNYDGSPQAHKSGAAQPSTPTTVRGPPPSYHTSVAPNMQATLPIKDKDSVDVDAGYGTALAPQKLVDKTSQHLQKSPAATQTSAKGTSKRIKDYLPTANSGCATKGSKNVPPPYSALRGTSLQTSFANKRGAVQESTHQSVHKTSISLPISLQDPHQGQEESLNGKSATSPPTSSNPLEKASKTRIPMGFKAFLKSPPGHKSGPTIPGKEEKDHISAVSKETVTSNVSTQCDSSQAVYCIDPTPMASVTEGTVEVLEEEVQPLAPSEEQSGGDKGKRESHLFGRSISINTKPHLKPALGMNGAKARSQSFSANYMEKPNIGGMEGPGRIRTQIITNSGERGSSLSRQSSLETTNGGLVESPVHSPRTRTSHYGGVTGANSQTILPEKPSQLGLTDEGPIVVKEEGVTSPSLKKEDRSLPNNQKPTKVAPHPQLQSPSTCVATEVGSITITTLMSSAVKSQPTEDKKLSPSACTIEEKVMMGIEENLQKSQEQEKAAAIEAKQKTGPSLANWFGLRKSKLPALSGKKAESPKAKEERKESKVGGKPAKADKKKDKKKDGQDVANLSEMNNKLSSIMDHCNNQMGQIASQIQCTTALIGKDQFVKELLGRAAAKGNASPPAISTPKKQGESKGDMQICTENTILLAQKISLKAENEEGHIADSACQDHMIGSGCQMRTLDSGIGTFPLPDSVTRAGSRHIPKSESSPDAVTSGSADVDRELHSPHHESSQPDVKVPSLPKTHPHPHAAGMGHSLSEPAVTCSRSARDTQSRLPKLPSSDAIRTKRLSLHAHRSSGGAAASNEGDQGGAERSGKAAEHVSPAADPAQCICIYSGSDANTETESEGTASTPASPQRSPLDKAPRNTSAELNGETLKKASAEEPLSIMDLYQHEVFSRSEKDDGRIPQYNLLHKDSTPDGNAGDRLSKELHMEQSPITPSQLSALSLSLEPLSKRSHGGCPAETGKAEENCRKVSSPPSCSSPNSSFASRPRVDPVGSLSDSLYDSFSSCTSQGSNGV